MLEELRINSVALIEELHMELFDGFSVLTGETGAGKSIIIEALNFVLGERASREIIMSGKTRAYVEAAFSLSENAPVLPLLAQYEIEAEGDFLVLYRELTASGKNACRINGVPVTTAILKSVGDELVDIHGQHAHQQLLNQRYHMQLLDAFAGSGTQTLKKEVAAAFSELSNAKRKLSAAVMDEKDRERRCDLLTYQINEIDKASLIPGEEETLLEQRKILQNGEAIMTSLDQASESLSGEEGVMSRLSDALHALDGVAPYSNDYAEPAERAREAYYSLEDVSATVRTLKNAFSFDPEELERTEWRLETISSLKRKYGDTVEEILSYREKIAEEYDLLLSSQQRHETLQADYAAAKKRYAVLAKKLTEERRTAGAALEKKLLPELSDLGMPHAAFSVSIEPLIEYGATGADNVEFLLSTNLGEPVKPLTKVASGGEISRIMLGFKSVLAGADIVDTMVFDEIDSGISGRIGTAVAEKMRQIAGKKQVLCITHLPQIAAYAHHQYAVSKVSDGERTRSTAALLTDSQRAVEIARIMGGAPDDAVAVQHARQLIDAAKAE